MRALPSVHLSWTTGAAHATLLRSRSCTSCVDEGKERGRRPRMETQRRRQGLVALVLTSAAVLMGFTISFVVTAESSAEREANWGSESRKIEEGAPNTSPRQDRRMEGFLSLEASLTRQLQKLEKHL